MSKVSCCLGIDTSNYKTSVAIVSCSGQIICNLQQYLKVKKGERGLRQSDALFQHVINLPSLVEEAYNALPPGYSVEAVSVSTKPRPVEGSYMPVFNGGIAVARSIAAAGNLPLIETSHQEGHIEAIKYYSKMRDLSKLISFHFSGGTTEALLVDETSEDCKIEIIGGTKDIAFGQVLDRAGVALGMEFPCGEEMDNMPEIEIPASGNLLPKIKTVEDGYINLSGIETKIQRLIEGGKVDKEHLVAMIFERIAEAIAEMCKKLSKKYMINDFLFAGGVSSSKRIRRKLEYKLKGLNIEFGEAKLSTDNAVGVALLGGQEIWH